MPRSPAPCGGTLSRLRLGRTRAAVDGCRVVLPILVLERRDQASLPLVHTMPANEYVIHLVLSVILIIGAYQFYFWCQRNGRVAPRELKLPLDERLPYWPSWVWIYSFLYYPLILYVNLVTRSPREFTHVATSYFVLLSVQMAFFLAFPVATPEHWRRYNQRRTLAERFRALVQKFDARSNSFPSMHVSVATLTAR